MSAFDELSQGRYELLGNQLRIDSRLDAQAALIMNLATRLGMESMSVRDALARLEAKAFQSRLEMLEDRDPGMAAHLIDRLQNDPRPRTGGANEDS